MDCTSKWHTSSRVPVPVNAYQSAEADDSTSCAQGQSSRGMSSWQDHLTAAASGDDELAAQLVAHAGQLDAAARDGQKPLLDALKAAGVAKKVATRTFSMRTTSQNAHGHAHAQPGTHGSEQTTLFHTDWYRASLRPILSMIIDSDHSSYSQFYCSFRFSSGRSYSVTCNVLRCNYRTGILRQTN